MNNSLSAEFLRTFRIEFIILLLAIIILILSLCKVKIMKDCYEDNDKYQFALDLENSGILISALIPWNIAALVPTTTMNVSTVGYIVYAFYLYIVPITYFIYSKYSNRIFNINTNRQSLS